MGYLIMPFVFLDEEPIQILCRIMIVLGIWAIIVVVTGALWNLTVNDSLKQLKNVNKTLEMQNEWISVLQKKDAERNQILDKDLRFLAEELHRMNENMQKNSSLSVRNGHSIDENNTKDLGNM